MNQLVLTNDVPLIGDFLGTIPAMVELAKTVQKLYVIHRHEVRGLFDMIPQRNMFRRVFDERDKPSDFTIRVSPNDTQAYWYATKHNLYMTQAHFSFLGLPTPLHPVRPVLHCQLTKVPTYDYILAPFSVSLPGDQMWPRERWKQLVRLMPNHSFAMFGSKTDDPNYLRAPNVTPEFGQPFAEVVNMMRNARYGVVSVVTGISHLAYALGVENCLLEHQDTAWGLNPDSYRIHRRVVDITVSEVSELLCTHAVEGVLDAIGGSTCG